MAGHRALLLLAAAGLAGLAHAAPQDKIKHVVVVMLENRAFDHRLGYFKKDLNPDIDGITGTEFNYLNVSSQTGRCDVSGQGDPWNTPNAGHSYASTINEQYGTKDVRPPYPPPQMNGFALNEDSCNVMHSIPTNQMPVSRALLENFVVFDRYFAEFPGPTEVNRMFWHSATSGLNTTGAFCDNPDDAEYVEGLKQRSLLDLLVAENVSVGVYMEDFVSSTVFFQDQRTEKALQNYHDMAKFHDDCKQGTLPMYSVIEPRYFSVEVAPANDEHPASHSIFQGERLYKTIYESLRNSPLWESSALIIIYDEHGGLYDHVPSPTNVPPPSKNLRCSKGGDQYYDFTRLGIRVPCIIASPWVPKGLVMHEPTGPARTFNTSQFTHSSVSRTLHDLFGLSTFLTARDEWAASFAPLLLSQDAPRTDTPASLPEPPSLSVEENMRMTAEYMQPLNDWQVSLVRGYAAMTGMQFDGNVTHPFGLQTEADGAKFMREQFSKLRASVLGRK